MLPRRGSQQAFWTLISILGCANGSMLQQLCSYGQLARAVKLPSLLALCGHCPTDGPSCPSRCIFSKGPKRRRGLQLGLFSATRPRPLALANCELAVLLAFFFFCLPIGQLHKKGCQMAFTHTQHVMRNGLSASSNLDQKSLKSLINGYFYMTIFQISKWLNRAKMHSISYRM